MPRPSVARPSDLWDGGPVTGSSFKKQATSSAGFIRAYGLFWDRDQVDWTGADSAGRLELLGRRNKNRPALQVVNSWEQRGIYVLYNNFGPYYVGKTLGDSLCLGARLRHHALGTNGSPHRDRWDRFSWFGWRGVLSSKDEDGLRHLRVVPGKLLTDSSSTVADIEALLIFSLGTRHLGNSKNENFAAALEWKQVWWHQRDHYLNKVAHRP